MLWIFLLVLLASSAHADVSVFNVTSPCALEGVCSFTDPMTWDDLTPPGHDDFVVIDTTHTVTMLIDSLSIELDSMFMYGPVTLVVFNSTFGVDAMNWSDTAVLEIQGSTCYFGAGAGGNLLLNESSLIIADYLTLNIANVSDSYIRAESIDIDSLTLTNTCEMANSFAEHTTVNSLYSYGSSNFKGSLNVRYNAYFTGAVAAESLSFLDSGSFLFDEMTIRINKMTTSLFTNVTISNTDVFVPSFIGSIYCEYYDCPLFLDNAVVSIGGANYIAVTVSNTVALFLNSKQVYFSTVTQNPNSFFSINCSTTLGFGFDTVLPNANIYIAYGGVLEVTYSLQVLPSVAGLCPISGAGKLSVQELAELICDGGLTIGSVDLSSNLTVGELTVLGELTVVPSMTHWVTAYITGDVMTQRLSLISGVLSIDGSYEQIGSGSDVPDIQLQYINYTDPMENAMLEVSAGVHISVGRIEVSIIGGFKKLLLIHAIDIKKAKVNLVRDMEDTKHSIEARITANKIVIQPHETTDIEWVQGYWMYFSIVFGVLLVATAALTKCVSKRMELEPLVVDTGSKVRTYFAEMSFSKLDGTAKLFSVAFLLPCILLSAVQTIVLATLIPLGFIFGLIERKLVFLWAWLTFIIQVGGLLDLFADIILLAKTSLWYALTQLGEAPDMGMANTAKEDFYLWVARVVITFVGAAYAVIFVTSLMSNSGIASYFNRMRGKSHEQAYYAPVMVNFIGQIVFIVFWKVLCIAMRVYLLFHVLKSLITKGRIEQIVQRRIWWLELMLYLDLMLTGLPLGILTALKMFYFSGEVDLSIAALFGLTKLGGLAINSMGTAFLIYFIVGGLSNKIDPHDNIDDESLSHSVNTTESQPLLNDD